MELLIAIVAIVAIAYSVSYWYAVGPNPDAKKSILEVRETSGKPLQIFYNKSRVTYRDGIVVDRVTDRPFVEPVKYVTVRLADNAPYELSVNFPYETMRIEDSEGFVFNSEKSYSPGNRFVVKRPELTVRMNLYKN